MAFEIPSAEELKKIARANHIELTAAELSGAARNDGGQAANPQKIDAIATAPQESVTRYRHRKAGTRPAPKDDPLNAIVTQCSVKGAASGPLKGKRVGVKDSVCVAGIPASGGSSVLKGHVAASDATIVARMLDAGAEIVATLNMDDFALSGDGRTSFYDRRAIRTIRNIARVVRHAGRRRRFTTTISISPSAPTRAVRSEFPHRGRAWSESSRPTAWCLTPA